MNESPSPRFSLPFFLLFLFHTLLFYFTMKLFALSAAITALLAVSDAAITRYTLQISTFICGQYSLISKESPLKRRARRLHKSLSDIHIPVNTWPKSTLDLMISINNRPHSKPMPMGKFSMVYQFPII